jgi:phosphinothricin acetyltransferase
VYVGPDHQGRGVGAALYGSLIPLLRGQGYVTLLAGITAGHTASERLHAKLGFLRSGTLHRVGWKHGRWCDVGYWELALDSRQGPPAAIRPVDEVWAELSGDA